MTSPRPTTWRRATCRKISGSGHEARTGFPLTAYKASPFRDQGAVRPHDETPQDETPTEPTSSRRNLLRMVGIGAAGVAAAGVAGVVAAGPAAAADPNDLDLTVASNPHATRTGTDYTGPNVASSFTVEA